MKKGEFYLGRKIVHKERFPCTGIYEGYLAAESRLHDMGYELGQQFKNDPIAFSRENKKLGKWQNIREDELSQLDGIILSEDFRECGCDVLFFNPPVTKKN
jgi:hypothetical protein